LRWNGLVVRNVGLRSRGNTTRNGIKPGLRVDINRYLSSQEFLGLKAFALDNDYSDASLVRESVTMKLFAKLGLAAPREAHARVFMNNEYIGAYVVIESLDRTFVSRTFGESEADVERGGYLFEYNWLRPYGFEDLGTSLEPYAELFTPKTRETDSMTALYAPIRDAIRAINETPDDRFIAVTGGYLDLPRFLKYVAIEDFMADTDGILSEWQLHNFYLYRFRDGRPAQFLPWDKDKSFSTIDHPIEYNLDNNVLTRRAMEIPELRQIYFDTLRDCVSMSTEPDPSDPRGWLEREVDRETQQVSPAVMDDPVFPFSFDRFEEEVQFLLQFARTRPQFVRCQLGVTLEDPEARQSCASLEGSGLTGAGF
jgi:spore coat protein H